MRAGMDIGGYRLIERLGSGGFGEVWTAHPRSDGGPTVAVKIPHLDDLDLARRRLGREGRTIARLSHPNIVKVLEVQEGATPPYLVMEYVPGPSLRQRINHGIIDVCEIRTIMKDVTAALICAHDAGILHRDLKPENVLLDASREKPTARLTDFGLAAPEQENGGWTILSASHRSTEGHWAGTLGYVAPEVVDGGPATIKADLYGLGAMLFEMATGRKPAGATRPSQMRQGLPGWIDELFVSLYSTPERRMNNGLEVLRFLHGIDRVVDGPARERVSPPLAWGKWGAWAAVSAILLLGLAGMLRVNAPPPVETPPVETAPLRVAKVLDNEVRPQIALRRPTEMSPPPEEPKQIVPPAPQTAETDDTPPGTVRTKKPEEHASEIPDNRVIGPGEITSMTLVTDVRAFDNEIMLSLRGLEDADAFKRSAIRRDIRGIDPHLFFYLEDAVLEGDGPLTHHVDERFSSTAGKVELTRSGSSVRVALHAKEAMKISISSIKVEGPRLHIVLSPPTDTDRTAHEAAKLRSETAKLKEATERLGDTTRRHPGAR